jgi:hypothetical protein
VPTLSAPCDWPLLFPSGCDALDTLATVPLDADGEGEGEGDARTMRGVVEGAAAALLWNWTGKAFGLCEATVRPCRVRCSPPPTYGVPAGVSGAFYPVLISGRWFNIGCGTCGYESCSCTHVESLELPGPIAEVVEIRIDGEALDEAAYWIDSGRRIIRTDGGRWPVCQDLSVPDGEPGSWSVTYRIGAPVPEGGQIAAGVLACEMAKAVAGRSDCELPERLQTVTREGVTVGFLDPFEGLEDGRTGLWLVDSWVASIQGSKARPRVYVPSPARPAVRRTSTFWGSGL